MKALLKLLAEAPLLDVVSINVKKNEITLDMGGWAIPATRKAGLVSGTQELRDALNQALQAVTLVSDGDGPRTVRFFTANDDTAYRVDTDGAKFRFYMERSENGTPSNWFGGEYRTDSLGREWSLHHGRLVMDDFGQLVSMEGGTQ